MPTLADTRSALHTDRTTIGEPPSLDVHVHAFFFDFDGTLAEIAETPDTVAIPDGLIADLTTLQHATGGALATISGRPIAALDRFLHPLRLAASGVHGLERRRSGDASIEAPMEFSKLDEARRVFGALARADDRLLVEDKGLAVALHYRRAPELGPQVLAVGRDILAARGGDVICQPGKMVVELRLAGSDKGQALRGLMASPAFSGRIPVMFGDDRTDEAAFEAARDVGGLAVHVGPSRPPLCASHLLPGPAAVRRLIARLAARATGMRATRRPTR